MNIKQKLTTGIATAAVLGGLMAPMAHAANTVTISGNLGAVNNIGIVKVNAVKTVQKSVTVANTTVVSSANTGGNTASGNLGGTTSQTTGAATSTVGVSVSGGDNSASASPCGCASDTNTVTVTGNLFSSNNVLLGGVNLSKTVQKSVTVANTTVVSSANTGGNTASGNLGTGATQTTNPATSTVGVEVSGGSNDL